MQTVQTTLWYYSKCSIDCLILSSQLEAKGVVRKVYAREVVCYEIVTHRCLNFALIRLWQLVTKDVVREVYVDKVVRHDVVTPTDRWIEKFTDVFIDKVRAPISCSAEKELKT